MNHDQEKTNITLQTLYFYQHELPPVIALHECGLKTSLSNIPLFCGVYGKKMLQNVLTDIRNSPRGPIPESFTMIEFTIESIRMPNMQMYFDRDDVRHYDYLPLDRLKRNFREELQSDTGLNCRTTNYHLTADRQQQLVRTLYDQTEFLHIKLFKFSSYINTGKQLIQFFGMPMRHWQSITSAQSIFDPELKIILEPPASYKHSDALTDNSPTRSRTVHLIR